MRNKCAELRSLGQSHPRYDSPSFFEMFKKEIKYGVKIANFLFFGVCVFVGFGMFQAGYGEGIYISGLGLGMIIANAWDNKF